MDLKALSKDPSRIVRGARRRAGAVGRRLLAAGSGSRPTLDEIGLSTGTDKASTTHEYLGVYEQLLGHLRDEKIQLLEIGVHKASSLRMWEKYFGNARIIGADLSDKCKAFEGGRITIEVGDQGNEKFVRLLGKRYRPTVLIDDGSHRWEHQILSFRTLWPTVKPGGFFIVEDIHTSFGDDYRPVYGREGTQDAYEYVADIVRGIVAGTRADKPKDQFEQYCRETIESATFLKHSIVIRKRDFPQPWYTRRSVADIPSERSWTGESESYDRIPAEVVGTGDGAARANARLQTVVEEGTITMAAPVSAVVKDVVVHDFGLATVGDSILAETLNSAQNVRYTSRLYRPFEDDHWVEAGRREAVRRPRRTDGRTQVLMRQTWDRNFGHWLIDSFGRLATLEGHVDLTTCVFQVNRQPNAQMQQVVLDSFELAGVGADQVEFCEILKDAYDELLVPGTIAATPLRKHPLVVRYLERLGEQVPTGPADRIYLSRAKASRRRILNEDAVVELLADRGFTVVHPEDLSLREQIATMRGASQVVGVMGAGLTNLVFSPAGVSVLALATESMQHDYFYDIVCHKKGRYRGLQGASAKAEGSHAAIGDDFEVDLALLKDSVDWLDQQD